MLKSYSLLFITFLFCQPDVYSQCVGCKDGRNPNDRTNHYKGIHNHKIGNGDSTLGVIFDSTLCGLNFVQGVQNTQTRYTATPGTGFPAPDTIVGLPAFTSCTHIIKAYLYCEASCYPVNPYTYTIVDTLTNPLSVKTVFRPVIVGADIRKCWSDSSTATWRADITSAISGNGVYKVNFSGFINEDYEVDGISIVIIYQDRSATYTGTFVLSDGQYTVDGGTLDYTATGFNACAASTNAIAFFDAADIQNNVGATFTASLNGVNTTFNSDFFQCAQINTSVASGQNSTTDSMTRISDCYAWFLSGLYFQTACLTCNTTTSISLTTQSTISPCNKDSGTAKVTVNDTGSFTFLWSNGSTLDSIYGVGAGTYTVTVTGPGGCPTDTATVTVEPADSLTVHLSITDNITCNGGNNGAISATASGGRTPYTYLWNNGNTTNSISGLSTGTYTLLTTDPNNCAVTSILTLRQPPPLGKLTNEVSPLCYGDSNGSITLNISGGTMPYTYQWTPSISTTNSVSGLKAGTFTITITDSSGCAVKDTVVLTQPAKIVPLITGRDTVCTGEEDTLKVTGGSTYLWSNGSTNTSITFIAPTTHTFTVTAYSGPCSHDTTITVTVLAPPTASITAKPDTICPKDSALLIGAGIGSYRWSNGKYTDSIWVKASDSITITLYISVGTCIDSAKKTIYIKPGGSTTLSVTKDTICPHDTTILSATGGTSYHWSNGSSGTSISVFPASTSTYTLIATNTCGVDTIVKTIHVTPLPKLTVTGRDSVCNGFGDTLTISGGASYLWSNGTTSTQYIFRNIYADSTVSVEVFNGNCHSDTSLKVGIKPPPGVTLNSQNICPGQCISLAATATGSGNTFKWSTGGTNDTINVCPTSNSTYSVTVSNGCIVKKTATVDIDTLIVCCSKSIEQGGADTISALNAGHYTWQPPTGLNCDTCQTVIASPTVTTTYTVTYESGCSTEITVTLECVDFTVPNVFTPNGDGRNDLFEIKALDLDKYSIIIYDRWGKEMYNSTNPLAYWDGNTVGGAKAPDGVYYYIIKSSCSGNNYDKQGFVQLIR